MKDGGEAHEEFQNQSKAQGSRSNRFFYTDAAAVCQLQPGQTRRVEVQAVPYMFEPVVAARGARHVFYLLEPLQL